MPRQCTTSTKRPSDPGHGPVWPLEDPGAIYAEAEYWKRFGSPDRPMGNQEIFICTDSRAASCLRSTLPDWPRVRTLSPGHPCPTTRPREKSSCSGRATCSRWWARAGCAYASIALSRWHKPQTPTAPSREERPPARCYWSRDLSASVPSVFSASSPIHADVSQQSYQRREIVVTHALRFGACKTATHGFEQGQGAAKSGLG